MLDFTLFRGYRCHLIITNGEWLAPVATNLTQGWEEAVQSRGQLGERHEEPERGYAALDDVELVLNRLGAEGLHRNATEQALAGPPCHACRHAKPLAECGPGEVLTLIGDRIPGAALLKVRLEDRRGCVTG